MKSEDCLKRFGQRNAFLCKNVSEVLEEVQGPGVPDGDLGTLGDCAIDAVLKHNISTKEISFVVEVFARLADRGIRSSAIFRIFCEKE